MNISTNDRITGCLYGMASGDAMGVPTSFLPPDYVKERWGWIDTFYPAPERHMWHEGLKAGEYTDDSEQAIGLMNSFIRNKRVDPRDVVKEILDWAERVKGKYASPLGPSTERALKAIRAGADITLSGKNGTTNGSAMRISPLGIIHGLRGSSCEECVRDVYLTCLPTHNTDVCVSTAAAIAWGVAVCVRGETDMDVIIRETMRAADLGAQYGYRCVMPSISGRISFIYRMVKEGTDQKQTLLEIYNLFAGNDLAADSVPFAIGMFALGKGDPVMVNQLCVNAGCDSDTNAAMAGAMAGAYSGVQAIPAFWKQTISETNHINLEEYAEKLQQIIPEWEVAKVEPGHPGCMIFR